MCSPMESGIMNTLMQSTPRQRKRRFPWCHLSPFLCGVFFHIGVQVAEALPQTGIDNNGVECFCKRTDVGKGDSESNSVSQNQGLSRLRKVGRHWFCSQSRRGAWSCRLPAQIDGIQGSPPASPPAACIKIRSLSWSPSICPLACAVPPPTQPGSGSAAWAPLEVCGPLLRIRV